MSGDDDMLGSGRASLTEPFPHGPPGVPDAALVNAPGPMTDAERARAIAIEIANGGRAPGSVLDGEVMSIAVALAAMCKPSHSITRRVDCGDFVRASGNATCEICDCSLFDHPTVNGYAWLRHACDGRLLKL